MKKKGEKVMDKIVKSQKRLRLKNMAVSWLLVFLMCFSVLPTGSMTVHATDVEPLATVSGGTGSEETLSGEGTETAPFIIEDETDLLLMAEYCNNNDGASGKYFKVKDGVGTISLTADWVPITSFVGSFDGNGVTIDGLSIKTTNGAKTGFFSVLNEGANVQNIDFANVNIDVSCDVDAEFCVGTIAGRVNGATIDNCKVLSGIVKAIGQASKKDIFVGGLVGDIYKDVANSSKTIITNCFNHSAVEAETNVGKVMRLGGIYGSLAQVGASAEIINCANIGSVIGTNTSANAGNSRFGGIGGIVTQGTVVIKNCYNAGTVSAGTGCLKYKLGSILGAGTGTIENCYYAEGTFDTVLGTATALATIQSVDFVTTLNTNVNTLSTKYSGLLNWKLNTDNYPIQFVETTQGGGSEPEPEPIYVAQIGDDKYETLQEAIDAANNAIVNQTATKVEIDL